MNIKNRGIPVLPAISVLILVISLNIFAEDNFYSVSDFRKLTEKWVDIRSEISNEKTVWQKEEKDIRREVELLKLESEKLNKEFNLIKQSYDKRLKEEKDLKIQKEKLTSLLNKLKILLDNIKAELIFFKAIIPSPLFYKVKTYYDILSTQKTDNLSENLKTALDLLKEIEVLQNTIHYYNDVLTIDDHPAREYEIISVGLSHAYCVASDDSIAGFGIPDKNGWQWKLSNDLTKKIREGIQIYKQEKMAEYIELPVKRNEVVK